MPVYAACLIEAALGRAEAPAYYAAARRPVARGAAMYAAALEWVRAAHPHWNRTQGRDHVW